MIYRTSYPEGDHSAGGSGYSNAASNGTAYVLSKPLLLAASGADKKRTVTALPRQALSSLDPSPMRRDELDLCINPRIHTAGGIA